MTTNIASRAARVTSAATGCPPLGCPSSYTAAVTTPCGSTVVPVAALGPLVKKVTWGRRVNDISRATVNLGPTAGPGCCPPTDDIEPWMHELEIYRDGEFVWSGPITTITTDETDGSVEIDAADPGHRLTKIVNTTNVGMDPWIGADVAEMAASMIAWELAHSAFACPPPAGCDCADEYCIGDRMVVEPSGITWKAGRAELWTAYLHDVLAKLAERAFEHYFVGHTLVIRPARGKDDPPRARLRSEHIDGGVQLVRSDDDLATRAFATNKTDTGTGNTAGERPGITVTTPGPGCPAAPCDVYGRVDFLTADTAGTATDATDDQIAAHLMDLAKGALAGRCPAPLSVRIADGAHLSPSAPVCINELIPGERYDLRTTGACHNIAAALRLAALDVTWENGTETVAVSFTPLTGPAMNITPENTRLPGGPA